MCNFIVDMMFRTTQLDRFEMDTVSGTLVGSVNRLPLLHHQSLIALHGLLDGAKSPDSITCHGLRVIVVMRKLASIFQNSWLGRAKSSGRGEACTSYGI